MTQAGPAGEGWGGLGPPPPTGAQLFREALALGWGSRVGPF